MQQTRLACMMLSVSILFACFLFSCKSNSKRNHTASTYPQPLPDSIPLSFLPGIVSTDSFDFNAAFSSDGHTFCFSRVINGVSKMYCTNFRYNKWQPAFELMHNDSSAQADPVFGPGDTLYFISNKLTSPSDTLRDYNIWYMALLPDNGFDTPEMLPSINSDSNEFYISFARNGNMYFSSSRQGGYGQEDLYVSKPENGKYTAPQNLGPNVNTDKSEYDPGITPDEKMLLFASSKRDDSYGMADLYYTKPTEKMIWMQPIHLDSTINTPTRDYCPYFTTDGKYFFFTSNKDVKWMSVQALKAAVDKHN